MRHLPRIIRPTSRFSLATATFLGFAIAPSAVKAEVTLPEIFSDHMVLQAETIAPIWGWAEPGEEICVDFRSLKGRTVADSNGRWRVKLEGLKAGETGSLTVSGRNTLTISDVLVGEVWLCSGQSNMAGKLGRREADSRDLPSLRIFHESSPGAGEAQEWSRGRWEVCSPAVVTGFSGTAYFFGKNLLEQLKRPVGLVVSAVGGTQIELWMPLPPRRIQTGAGSCFDGKIAPLLGYGIRGAVWYQGESNARTPEQGMLYANQLPKLIGEWRQRWGQGDFPFAWVQLPNFSGQGFEGWCEVRESMLKTLAVPNTGMAVTIDYSGDSKNLHPGNKEVVGHRLALWALAKVYGQKIPYSGPLFSSHQIKDASMVCSFTHGEGGLMAREGGELTGFVIAGADRQWHSADARIEGEMVWVSSREVPNPVAVRYGWAPDPKCNLVNGAGLPATPFRTDDWPSALHAPNLRSK